MKRRMSDVVDQQFLDSRYYCGGSLKSPKTIVSRLVNGILSLIPKPNNKMHGILNLYGGLEWVCEILGIENVGDLFSACSVVLLWYGTVKVIINLSRTVLFIRSSFLFSENHFFKFISLFVFYFHIIYRFDRISRGTARIK